MKKYNIKTTDVELLKKWYYLMTLGRALDEKAPAYLLQSLGWSFHAPYAGHDGIQLAIGQVFTKGEDFLFPYYRAKQEQRTLAVQISDDMFQRLKSYLDAHAPLTQKALVQSLLNQALDQWEHGEEPLQSAVLQDNKKERTLAIAMPESLFHRVEQYVEAHNGVSKRVFVVGLVAQELQSWLMEQSPDEVQDQEFGPDQDEQGFGMSMTM